MVVSGVEKMGKTTFAASAPRALLVPLEQGYGGVDVYAVDMLTNYLQVIALLDETLNACSMDAQAAGAALAAGQPAPAPTFGFKTLIFDSAVKLEELIHEHTIAIDPKKKANSTMASTHEGFGKGYEVANGLFKAFLDRCDLLAIHFNINIVLTSHVFAGIVKDPTAGEYDTWDLLLHSPKNGKTYGKREMITQWADVVGFLHEPVLMTVDKDADIKLAISADEGRIMGVQRTPGYVAGNRYGLTETLQIPQEDGWQVLAQAIFDSKGLDYFNPDRPKPDGAVTQTTSSSTTPLTNTGLPDAPVITIT